MEKALLIARFVVALGVIIVSILLLIKKGLIAKYAKQAEIGVGLNLTRDRKKFLSHMTRVMWIIVAIILLALGAQVALTLVL